MGNKHLIVENGLDPLTRPILEYLERTYGIPAQDIRSLALDSSVSEIQLVTVTLMVHAPTPAPTPAPAPPAADTQVMPRVWTGLVTEHD